MDRAIAASSATQLIRFATGPVTMILIVAFLSPEAQGFYYSFGGVVGIQVFLQAGFAQSITQFTSKEFASLGFNRQGLLTGDLAALSRLRSIFQKANRYYAMMAGVLTIALAVGGYFFFSSKPDHGVPWQIPWFVISACAGVGFLLTPIWAMLEGCNLVAHVAIYRFWMTLVGFGTAAICLISGLGIYVSLWTSVASLTFPIAYLFLRWRHLILQILRPPGREQVSWRKDIWGFQWRIAMVWAFKYLLFPITPALAFALFGPIVAGKIGLCYQLALIGCAIGTTWTVTKIPRWGAMIAQGKLYNFEREWLTGSKFHIGVVVLSQLGALFAISLIHLIGFEFSGRFLSPPAFCGFALGIVFHSFWLVFSHYFRASRQEPFLMVTIISAVIYLGAAWAFKSQGSIAITYSFALANLIGSIISFFIWKKRIRI